MGGRQEVRWEAGNVSKLRCCVTLGQSPDLSELESLHLDIKRG